MKRFRFLAVAVGLMQLSQLKCFGDEELTIDLYIPKYALTGVSRENDTLPYSMPADPVAALGEIVDPKTESPVRIHFVNNMNTQDGDGSYGNPFNRLEAAQAVSNANDIIYVYRGDGTSHGMDKGIVLKDGQHLLGSNHSYEFETKFGTFYLPATTSESPVITHVAGNGIELANQNEVHGLVVDSPSGWCIHGKDVCEGQVRHMTIIASSRVSGAIGLENVLGHFDISENTLRGSGVESVNGIDIRNHGDSMANFAIQGNQIAHFGEGIVLYTFDRSIAVSQIEFNTIGACCKSEVETKAFDSSELNSIVADSRWTD